MTDDKSLRARSQKPEAGSRKQEAGSRKQEAGSQRGSGANPRFTADFPVTGVQGVDFDKPVVLQ
jgi:hypothetical protein